MQDNQLKTSVVTVGQLLQYNLLKIPVYQRPYKWTQKNVMQLLKDIHTFRDKSAYRLGTIVLHNDGVNYNIVDGQQRIITLILVFQAIAKSHIKIIRNSELRQLLQKIQSLIINPEFRNDISIINVSKNYELINRELISFDEEIISFLFNRCEFIQFVLSDVSEAFQFFDAQNSRGRDLEPHDLLKAFHLREFSEQDNPLQTTIVDTWESMQTDELSELFADFLFRVRSWSRMISARHFTKNEIDLFKGVNIDKLDAYAYAVPLRIIHHFIDQYRDNYERLVDMHKLSYPFQLDQTIINGRRFFEMISYYKAKYDNYRDGSTSIHSSLNEVSREIIEILDSYEARHRIGDVYVRMLFDCTLLFYIDRFGDKDLDNAIEKIFIWAYSIRMNYQNIQMASVDNYVLGENNLFRIIKDATTPDDLYAIKLPSIERNYSPKAREIENLFRKLKYYGVNES
jgi:uncharacterized protein with ParB-like and HNH nuclease domain